MSRPARRRYIYAIDNFTGYESVQFSQAEDWILVSSYIESILIEVETSTVVQLPIGSALSAGWWPNHGAASLAVLHHDDGGMKLACFDCSTGKMSLVGPINSPQSDLTVDRQLYTDIVVHPVKNLALVGAREGPSCSYQEEHGSRARVAQLDLDTRELVPMHDPFVGDGDSFERCHSSWRWVSSKPLSNFAMSDELISMAECKPCSEPTDTEYVGQDADGLLILAVNRLIDAMSDVQTLRPDVLRAFEGSVRYSDRQDLVEWVQGLSREVSEVVDSLKAEYGSNESGWPRAGSGLAAFSRGLDLILAGRPDEVDWAAGRQMQSPSQC